MAAQPTEAQNAAWCALCGPKLAAKSRPKSLAENWVVGGYSYQLDTKGGDLQRRQARKIVAHSASCGWRIRAMFFQPRRGERMGRRFLSPLRGSGPTWRIPLSPQLALWATIFRPLRGLISATHYRECFDRLKTLCRMSNSYQSHIPDDRAPRSSLLKIAGVAAGLPRHVSDEVNTDGEAKPPPRPR